MAAVASPTTSGAIEVSWQAPTGEEQPVGYTLLPERQGSDGTWRSVSATAADGPATVTWTAAPSNGGTITAYTVIAQQDGVDPVTVAGTAMSAVVAGLDNATEYTFRVRATNLRGDGPLSAETNTGTPDTAAGTPGDGEDPVDSDDGVPPGGRCT